MYRTHTCGDITAKDSGKKVTLSGWVHSVRDHGDLIFVDLRDRYGISQVVSDPKNSASIHTVFESLKPESVIQVTGTVRKRPAEMVNENISTGEVELLASDITILSISKTPPFEIDQEKNVNEELRLKYRYLDLRHDRLKNNMIARHEMILEMRNFLSKNNFVEVETPILIKGTPEGSREYLVPSRVHPGNCYVLPQSPQQLKQLLMVAGFDRYFQVARCFRDEDQRGDRQPEFTQLDIEMSFIKQNDIIELIESLLINLSKKFVKGKKMMHKKFPRITWQEAMERYGSDKPDIRFEMELVDITDIAEKSAFKVFSDVVKRGGVVKALRAPGFATTARSYIESKLIPMVQELGAKGMAYIMYKDEKESPILKFLSEEEIKAIEKKTGVKKGDVLFFMADDFNLACECLGAVRLKLAHELNMIPENTLAYLWVTDFPLFEKDKVSGTLAATHHPFTSPKQEDFPLLDTEPDRVRSDAYDIVLNGSEIGGGSIRIFDRKIQTKIFELLNLTGEQIQSRFGHMLEAFEYGPPPHGGIALGLDRLTMIFRDEPNIREVIAFPKDQKARDLMLDAPSIMPPENLKEANIKFL